VRASAGSVCHPPRAAARQRRKTFVASAIEAMSSLMTPALLLTAISALAPRNDRSIAAPRASAMPARWAKVHDCERPTRWREALDDHDCQLLKEEETATRTGRPAPAATNYTELVRGSSSGWTGGSSSSPGRKGSADTADLRLRCLCSCSFFSSWLGEGSAGAGPPPAASSKAGSECGRSAPAPAILTAALTFAAARLRFCTASAAAAASAPALHVLRVALIWSKLQFLMALASSPGFSGM